MGNRQRFSVHLKTQKRLRMERACRIKAHEIFFVRSIQPDVWGAGRRERRNILSREVPEANAGPLNNFRPPFNAVQFRNLLDSRQLLNLTETDS